MFYGKNTIIRALNKHQQKELASPLYFKQITKLVLKFQFTYFLKRVLKAIKD